MTTREDIIKKLNQHTSTRYEMPDIELTTITYPDLTDQFINISQFVEGNVLLLKKGEDINSIIPTLYPEAKQIVSNLPEINIATINPDEVDDPHQLDNLDLSVIQGEIGVAENGCVWIPQQVKQKVIYFISEYLVILLDKNKLVPTMHDAYQLTKEEKYGFGVFISGPSKTADIEQALVVGAHGAKGVTVILY